MALTNPPNPTPPISGALIKVSEFGKPVTDSLTELDLRTSDASTGNPALGTRVGALETTVNATGTTAAGNAALSSRLGNGVTTASTATAQLATKAATATTITAGTGLTGGGDLSANRTLAVAYGNTSTTSASGDRALALENGRSLNRVSRWYSTENVTHTSATQAVTTWNADGTLAGDITVSGSTFTVVNTGVYDFTCNYVGLYNLTYNATAGYAQIGFNANLFLADIALTKVYAQAEYFYYQYASGQLELAMNINSGPIALAAGTTFAMKVGCAQNVTTSNPASSPADNYKRTFLAVLRIS